MQNFPSGEDSSSRRILSGERRLVTILFSDVKGSTAIAENLDPEDWAEIMNEGFDYLTRPIIRYGGTVARLMGDAILAFFGAPIAHEDDPLRAVLAGLDIVNGLEPFRQKINSEFGLDFNVRVGINTGIVVVGQMGSAIAGEYTAMGDAVNLAARMEQTALPGTVQITEETYRLVAPWIEVEPLGEVVAKGKSEPVASYHVLAKKLEPTRARGIAGLRSPLVGREVEFTQLSSLLSDLGAGQGRIVTLTGEAGLGKSRLIEELHEELDRNAPRGYQWVEARGISYESSRPYGLFIQALRQFCQVNDDDSLEIINKKVRESFNSLTLEQQSGITNTVELLLTIHNGSSGIEPTFKGESVRKEIFESILDIWSVKAQRGPLITVFDDLQWADSASIELLENLFKLAGDLPILFVCAFRPHRETASWKMKISAAEMYPDLYHEIRLTSLDEDNSSQLVKNLLSIADLPSEIRVSILEKSEGNPFYIEEVVRTLIDSGMIQRDQENQRWQLAGHLKEIDIPDNLQALLLARIDRLEGDPRRILQYASVIGREFSFNLLQKISDSPENLENHLEILQKSDLIEAKTSSPEKMYYFHHELTREAAYQSILRRQRRDFHQQVGIALEELSSKRISEVAHLLAYHFNAARAYSQALKYFKLAGDQSLTLFANQQASDYYAQAIELALKLNVPNVQLSGLYTLNGRALELLNQFDRALDNYEELEELGQTRRDRSLELAALVPQATIYSTPNVKFNPKTGQELSKKALNLAIDLRDYEAEAKSLWSLMLIQTFDGDLEQGILYGEQGLRIAREHDLRNVMAHIQHDLARPYMRIGSLNKAWDAYHNSQNYWREINNLPMLSDNLASLAESYYTAGEFDHALELAQEGLKISQEIGNLWGQAYCYFVIGPILLELGKIDQCQQALEKTLELSTEANFAAGIVATKMIKSWMFTMFGRLDRSVEIQREIRTFVESYESFRPLYFVNLAQNKLFLGSPEEALQIFEEIEVNYRRDSELIFHPYIYTLHVEIQLANKSYANAVQTADYYLDSFRNNQVELLVPDLMNQKARALMGLGDIPQAYRVLQSAYEMAKNQKSRRILWAILLDLAAIEQDDVKGAELYTEAQENIQYICEHLSDPELLASFQENPKIQQFI
ncbi:MAG: AAA family ATPase [Chloroflexota bacterium]|nr:MAG: AAA family ATPase [Chloroflexota bacterium]